MGLLLVGLLVLPLVSGAFQPLPKNVGLIIKACNNLDEGLCKAVPACAFCVSRFGEAHCFAQAVTANLPDDLYPCRYMLSTGPNNACEGKSEADCKASSCSWCQSAAVGNACYTPEDAARLPSAIFSCTMPSAQLGFQATKAPAKGIHADGAGIDSLGVSHLTLGSQAQGAVLSGASSAANSTGATAG